MRTLISARHATETDHERMENKECLFGGICIRRTMLADHFIWPTINVCDVRMLNEHCSFKGSNNFLLQDKIIA